METWVGPGVRELGLLQTWWPDEDTGLFSEVFPYAVTFVADCIAMSSVVGFGRMFDVLLLGFIVQDRDSD